MGNERRFDVKDAIRQNAEASVDWEFHNDAVFFYDLAVRFRNELIDPIARIDREQMSDPVISFEDERNKEVLATYTVGRNALGLKDQINFNSSHYTEEKGQRVWKYGRWSQCETLLHEQVHLYLHHLTDIDKKRRPEHGVEFVQKCLELGLHVTPVRGSHYEVANAESPFGRVMKELGIKRPKDVPRSDKRDYFRPQKEKGKSTLHKWVCPDCGLAVRIGIKDDPHLIHEACGSTLIRAEKGVVYKAKK